MILESILFIFSDGVLVPPVSELPAWPDPLCGVPPSLVPPPGHVPRTPLPCPLTLHIRLQEPEDQVSPSLPGPST
jgi:hypothetical protein